MIIKHEVLNTLRVTFKTLFERGLNVVTQWNKVATEMKSASADNVYGWLGKFPKLHKWIGERQLLHMKEDGYKLTNEKYESTVAVSRDDIEDDNLGIYNPIVEQMGQAANEHIDENVFQCLVNGFVNLCFDGKPFFASDHPINSQEDGQGTEGTFSNIINPEVTNKQPWFLLDGSKVIKPIIYQNRKNAELKQLFDSSNDHVFMNDEYLYGVDARRGFGYTFPQLAVACRDTLNAENFSKACQALYEMQTDGYRPLNCKPTILVVGPKNRAAAVDLLDKQYLANGESNVNYKIVEVLVTPYINGVSACTDPTITVEDDGTSSVGITISAGVGETIHYTVDGSTPNADSPVYSGPFTVTGAGSKTIKAIAMKAGSENSSVVIKTVTVAPTPTCTKPTITLTNDGTSSVTATITGADGETIHYTTDGSTPTSESDVYSVPLTLTSAGEVTIKAIAVKNGYNNSAVASKKATVTE